MSEENQHTTKKHSLAPTHARFLYALWKINKDRASDATYTLLKEEWDKQLQPGEKPVTINHLRSLAMDIALLPSTCIEKYEIFDDGKTHVAFQLHHSIVTLPQTARILLELIEFKPKRSMPYRLPRKEFATHIEENFGWKQTFTLDRLDLGIKSGYLLNATDADVWPYVRLKREREFIKLIAAEAEQL